MKLHYKKIAYLIGYIIILIIIKVLFQSSKSNSDITQYSNLSPLITHYDPEKFQRGLNFILPKETGYAYLYDMEGHKVHEWVDPKKDQPQGSIWYHGIPLKDLSMLVVEDSDSEESNSLLLMDKNSNILWQVFDDFHHEVQKITDDQILVYQQKSAEIMIDNEKCRVIDNYLSYYSIKGELIKRISLFDKVKNYISKDILRRACSTNKVKYNKQNARNIWLARDVLHANTFYIVDKNHRSPFNQGDLLLSFKRFNGIILLDKNTYQVKWFETGLTNQQHHATVADNGNILVFDNREDIPGKQSRVLEYNPYTQRLVWEYGVLKEHQNFFSSWGGGIEELSNGNRLVSVPSESRAFELSGKNVVWQIDLNTLHKEESRQFFRLTRVYK